MNICIITGGFSVEREVALNSAIFVSTMLASDHTVMMVDLVDTESILELDASRLIKDFQELPKRFQTTKVLQPLFAQYQVQEHKLVDYLTMQKTDFVFLALHGEYGEDGGIQSVLEALDLPFNGSDSFVSRLCMDKVGTTEIMKSRVRVPNTIEVSLAELQELDEERFKNIQTRLGERFFAKPRAGGSSVGNKVVTDLGDLNTLLATDYLFQELLEGRELTVSVLNGTSLPIIEIVSENNFDYTDKYISATTQEIVPAKLGETITERIQKLSEELFKLLGCKGLARFDYILVGEQPVFLEVNTLPGLTYSSLAPKAARSAGLSDVEFLEAQINRG